MKLPLQSSTDILSYHFDFMIPGKMQCPPGTFKCDNDKCLGLKLRCNGINECGDYSDEYNCTCDTETEFMCNDRACIQKSFVCDRDKDCSDHSDEINCSKFISLYQRRY